MQEFSEKLLAWFDCHGRKDLPWQQDRTAYRVWVSEIMLQQTQVATVIPYYERFMQRFPQVEALAAADIDEVLHHWSGLGYYARGRNLHKAAVYVVNELQGQFPQQLDEMMQLPGVGRSTAAAVLAQAFDQPEAILDGNVKRVLSRYYAVPGWPGDKKVSDRLWVHAEALTPTERLADYTQAIMDLGATLCKRSKPGCEYCPVSEGCEAYQQNNVAAYPASKPKREIPTKAVQMLLLQNEQGQLLLERRPPSGIWGGLLSFPELAPEEDAQQWCETFIGATHQAGILPAIQHTFSHFRLHISPVWLNLEKVKPQVMSEDRWVWYQPGESVAGMAAPVSKLIKQLGDISPQLELVG